MRNPHRGLTIALWGLGLGAFSLIAWLWLGAGDSGGVGIVLLIFGVTGVLFGGMFALLQHQNVRTAQALARSEDIIARWRVEAEDWQRFVASDPQWSSHAQGRLNEFSPSETGESDGVEVIVGKAGVQIGDSIHRLPLRSTPEITEARLHNGTPPVIELLLYYPPYATRFGMSPARYTALRFPAASGDLAGARQVVAHFRGDLPGEPDFFHGRGDGTNPEDLSKCYHCGFETHKLRSHCPKCGTTLQSRRWSRRFGLLAAVMRARIGWHWYAFVLGVPMLLCLIAAAVALPLTGSHLAVPGPDKLRELPERFIFILLFIGLGEELGWRGFALPALQEKHSPLVASLILAPIWAVWHLPLFGHEFPAPIIPPFLLGLLGATLVQTWLFNRSQGSVLLQMLFHATVNTVGVGLLFPLFTGSALIVLWWINGALWFVFGAVLLVRASSPARVDTIASHRAITTGR